MSRPPIRLRSACDACSSAKTKCDKKQPVCDRCQASGFICSYRPSRRHGKHPWAEKASTSSPGLTPLSQSIFERQDPIVITATSEQPGEMIGVDSVNASKDGHVVDARATFVAFDTPGNIDGDGSNFNYLSSLWPQWTAGTDL
jgi:hypothetical protein